MLEAPPPTLVVPSGRPQPRQIAERIEHIQKLFALACEKSFAGNQPLVLCRAAQEIARMADCCGLDAVRQASGVLAESLRKLLNDGSSPDASDEAALRYLFKRLSRLGTSLDTHVAAAARSSPLILLSRAETIRREGVVDLVQRSGFEVNTFQRVTDLKGLEDDPPAALVIDLEQLLDPPESAALVEFRRAWQPAPMIIALSDKDDIETRLRAVRSGATRLFVRPLDSERFTATLASLRGRLPSEPYRVLVVDDSVAQTDYYGSVLESVGMRVRAVHDPLLALSAIREFSPDLVLLDIYMPHCNGTELAQMIRSEETLALMPIVFLSIEARLDRQLAAMSLGGDDFLTKPVEPWHLLGSLLPRLEYARRSHDVNSRLEASVRDAERLKAAINRHAIVSIEDVSGTITDVNNLLCDVTGYSRQELLGRPAEMLRSETRPELFHSVDADDVTRGQIWHGLVCNRRKNGQPLWTDTTITPLLDADGLPYQYVTVRTDISELVALNERLKDSEKILTREVAERTEELRLTQLEVIRRLSLAAEFRDSETGLHIVRMSEIAAAIARALGLPAHEIDLILRAAPMHDVGKIGIPDNILLKPGKLEPDEFEIMKKHTTIGARLLGGHDSELMRMAHEIALNHHERWDGLGYPGGLASERIPRVARIAAIADVFDALTCLRPYKAAWREEDAIAYIRENAGTQFDPQLVEAFFAALPEILAIRRRHAEPAA